MSRILKTGDPRITNGYSASHNAVDVVKAPSQLDEIIAHSAGKVIFCQTGYKNAKGSKGNASYGNCVKIDHGNGFATLYAHLDRVDVRLGQQVAQGQTIGRMGNTGNSYGAHLHFEVWQNGRRINPVPYLNANLPIPAPVAINVKYQSHDQKTKQWLPEVMGNADYAGNIGNALDGLYANLTTGNIYYAIHTRENGWLPEVCNRNDYAGNFNQSADGIMIKTDTGKPVKYRVHILGGGWLHTLCVYNRHDSINGYAGNLGQIIDAVQIWF